MRRFHMIFSKPGKKMGLCFEDQLSTNDVGDYTEFTPEESLGGVWVRWEDVKDLIDIGEKLDALPGKIAHAIKWAKP